MTAVCEARSDGGTRCAAPADAATLLCDRHATPVTISLTAVADGPRQFCGAYGGHQAPDQDSHSHTVATYVSVRVVDHHGARSWHYCPETADRAADLVDNLTAAYRGRGLIVEVTR